MPKRKRNESNGNIIVVGSCNIDLIAYTDEFPTLGQTVLGTNFKQGFGGKVELFNVYFLFFRINLIHR